MICGPAQQSWDNSTGRYVQQAVKHVLVVNPKKFAPGKLAPASSAEASGEYPVTYYATYIDGKKVLEIDILNFIYYVNGVVISKTSKGTWQVKPGGASRWVLLCPFLYLKI